MRRRDSRPTGVGGVVMQVTCQTRVRFKPRPIHRDVLHGNTMIRRNWRIRTAKVEARIDRWVDGKLGSGLVRITKITAGIAISRAWILGRGSWSTTATASVVLSTSLR